MKQEFIKRQGARRLLLFFAGWGMDSRPFRAFRPEDDEDYLICYDYRSVDFRRELLEGYAELRIAAWSMGVWMADNVWRRYWDFFPRLSGTVALNGTLCPIDAQQGIPPRVYDLTLRGMKTEADVQNFYRRMCSNEEEYRRFAEHCPCRPVEELRQELAALRTLTALPEGSCPDKAAGLPWSKAYIGRADRIFPPQAQQLAWRTMGVVEELACGHWPFSVGRFLNAAGETEWRLLFAEQNG